MEQFALEFGPGRRVWKVSALNAAVRDLLCREFDDIWVEGEISGAKLAPSGHYYFTLKEQDSQVRCVMFRSAHRYLKFKPQDGLAVLARGGHTMPTRSRPRCEPREGAGTAFGA